MILFQMNTRALVHVVAVFRAENILRLLIIRLDHLTKPFDRDVDLVVMDRGIIRLLPHLLHQILFRVNGALILDKEFQQIKQDELILEVDFSELFFTNSVVFLIKHQIEGGLGSIADPIHQLVQHAIQAHVVLRIDRASRQIRVETGHVLVTGVGINRSQPIEKVHAGIEILGRLQLVISLPAKIDGLIVFLGLLENDGVQNQRRGLQFRKIEELIEDLKIVDLLQGVLETGRRHVSIDRGKTEDGVADIFLVVRREGDGERLLQIIESDVLLLLVEGAKGQRVIGLRIQLEAFFKNQILKPFFRGIDFIELLTFRINAQQNMQAFQVFGEFPFGEIGVRGFLELRFGLREIAAVRVEAAEFEYFFSGRLHDISTNVRILCGGQVLQNLSFGSMPSDARCLVFNQDEK